MCTHILSRTRLLTSNLSPAGWERHAKSFFVCSSLWSLSLVSTFSPFKKKKVSDIVHLRLKVTIHEMNPPPLMDILKSQGTGAWAIQTHCMLNLEKLQKNKNIIIKLLFFCQCPGTVSRYRLTAC